MSPKTVYDYAGEYTRRHWGVIPVLHRSKKPRIKEWPHALFKENDLVRHFRQGPVNIGVLMGEPSGGLMDVDLDCPEAIKLGPCFLEATCTFGHESKPESHWLYTVSDPCRTITFDDPVEKNKKRRRLVELRGTGGHTVFPGSTHESGEPITWHDDGDPLKADIVDLRWWVAKIAAAALLARYWPSEGCRQDASMALAGGLTQAEWPRIDIEKFIGAVADAAGDEEAGDRVKKDPVVLDTLAAAHAAAGRFGRAAPLAQSARALAVSSGADNLAAEIGKRRELYKQGRPFRMKGRESGSG